MDTDYLAKAKRLLEVDAFGQQPDQEYLLRAVVHAMIDVAESLRSVAAPMPATATPLTLTMCPNCQAVSASPDV